MEKIKEQVAAHKHLHWEEAYFETSTALCVGLCCNAIDDILGSSSIGCGHCIGSISVEQLNQVEPNLSKHNVEQAIKTVILLDIK